MNAKQYALQECSNCVSGSCIIHDITCGLPCNYFAKAVLPAAPEAVKDNYTKLYVEIARHNAVQSSVEVNKPRKGRESVCNFNRRIAKTGIGGAE